jgi:hypothetical protein
MTADALPPCPPGPWDAEAWAEYLRLARPADSASYLGHTVIDDADSAALWPPPTEPSRAWVTVRGECPECGKRYNVTVRADRRVITCPRVSCAHLIELPPMEAP